MITVKVFTHANVVVVTTVLTTMMKNMERTLMSDDIVTRLRMSANLMQGFPHMKAQHFNAEWVAEAADEIERLRAGSKQWRNLAMKEHITFCDIEDHELCVDYLEWRHKQEMREAGWQ